MPDEFTISCVNDKIWNHVDLVRFLSNHQRKDITLFINPEAIDLSQLGLYDLLDCFEFASVRIGTWNQLETSDKYNITTNIGNRFLTENIAEVTDTARLHAWNGQKVFLTCYGRPTANRLGLAAYLNSHYPAMSLVHFSGGAALNDLTLYELDKLAEFRLESVKEAVELIPQLPRLYNSETAYDFAHYKFDDPLTQCYENIFVDIVSESHVLGNTFFATEKTTRPMWLKKPFIVFASTSYLCYLRQMGFKTFSEFWDESYDGHQGRDRFVKILELIDSLANKSTSELEQMYQGMQNILDHNYNLLLNQTYNPTIISIQ